MEDLKERYYNIVNNLNVIRNVSTEMLAYDADHERRRKKQLNKLLTRTNEEVVAELSLMETEIEIIRNCRSKRRKS